VGKEGEYTLMESFMEGKGTFGGQMARSPEVVAAMEREGREGRKKGGGEGGRNGSAELLCPEGHQSWWRPTVT
jgi:hypothetical protein